MSYAYAKELDPKKIPVIDVSSLRNGSDKVSVAKKLHEANKNLGFLYVSNHGISNTTIKKTREYGLQFFNKNTKEIKRKVQTTCPTDLSKETYQKMPKNKCIFMCYFQKSRCSEKLSNTCSNIQK